MSEKTAQFSTAAKWCHWLVAFFLFSMMLEAFGFKWKPPEYRGSAIPVHVSIGVIVLGITFFRLAWRAANPPPLPPEGSPAWMKVGAKAGHWLLYFLFLAMAALGLFMAAISPVDIRIFSGFNVSDLAPANPELLALLRPVHFAGAVGFVLVLVGHIAGALWHHFLLRDDVLVRMLPFSVFTQKTLAKGKPDAWRFPSQNGVDWGRKSTWFLDRAR